MTWKIHVWYFRSGVLYHSDYDMDADTYRFKVGIGEVKYITVFNKNIDVYIKWVNDDGLGLRLSWIWIGTSKFDFRKCSFRSDLSNVVKVTKEIAEELAPVLLYKLAKGSKFNPWEHTRFRKVLLESCKKILGGTAVIKPEIEMSGFTKCNLLDSKEGSKNQ